MRHPRRRVIVGGVDLTERFGMDLLDGFTLSPPAPKAYTVDIPGGDGVVDVTEALSGDVAYDDRQMSFTFLVRRPAGFEATKTAVAGMLHGRRFPFVLSWDPGYTYTGRFTVSEWYAEMHHGQIKVDVDAEPYKLRESRTVRVAAAGGTEAVLECGRRRQCPTVECASECLVFVGGEGVRLQPGAWRLPELWLAQGTNYVWVDSLPGVGDVPISEHAEEAVSLHASRHIAELFWKERPADTEARAVYITYDVEEL